MLTFGRAFGLLVPSLTLGALVACSAGSKPSPSLDPQQSGGNGGVGGGTGGGGVGGTPVITGGTGGGTGGSIAMTGGASGSAGMNAGTGGTDIQECAGSVEMGMPVPVDVYVMLDISHSMIDPDPAKWDSIKSALGAFFADQQSAGLSVAIQYFPLPVPGVPATCTTDAECGAGAPCLNKICKLGPPGALVSCSVLGDAADCTSVVVADDGPCMVEPGATAMTCHLSGKTCAGPADCQTIGTLNGQPTGDPVLGACADYGVCANDNTYSCADTNATSNPKGCGTALGACVPTTSYFCAHDALCDPLDYKTPAVEFLTLPDTANALGTSIAAQVPAGATPTRPALRGAIAHGREWAGAHPGHTVVVVLATDGVPTDCTGGRGVFGIDSPSALADVIATATEGYTPAVAGNASVQTFVVGVFAQTETMAQSQLDQIAMAGGSERAFVINSGGNVQQDFLAALNQIRSAHLGCEFQIPQPKGGAMLDYALVNVELTTDKMSSLYYVEPDKCTGAADEWHYDVAAPAVPTKIVACPATCDMLKQTQNAKIDVKLGCVHIVK